MSYSIFYKAMFVKTRRGIIPMLEMGDNNVWDADGRKRSRNWEGLHLEGYKKFYTHDEIFNGIEKWNTHYKEKLAADLTSDDGWRKSGGSFGFYEAISVYGKHTTSTTFSDIKNMFTAGEKLMVSIDDAIKNLGLYISYYVKNEGDKWSHSERIHFSSEEEMFQIIDEKFGGEENEFWFHFNDYAANNRYDWQKAVSCLLSNKPGRKARWYSSDSKYIIEITLRDNEKTHKYVSVKDGTLVLTDNIIEAHIFNKQKAGGKSVSDIIFRVFPDVRSIHFEYDYNKLLNIAA